MTSRDVRVVVVSLLLSDESAMIESELAEDSGWGVGVRTPGSPTLFPLMTCHAARLRESYVYLMFKAAFYAELI